MKRVVCRTIAAAVAVAACATGAFAQVEGRPPSGAVLGGIGGRATNGESLNLRIDLGGAYDQDVVAHARGITFEGSGLYSMLTPQVDFKSHHDRLELGITAASNARYYDELHQAIVTGHSVGIGLKSQLTQRTSLSLSQDATYSPAILSGLFASVGQPAVGEIAAPGSNYRVNTNHGYSYGTTVGLSHKITGRAALEFNASVRNSEFSGPDPGYSSVRSGEAGGRFSFGLSRNVKLRLGQTFRQGQYAGQPRSREQTVDIGIEYARALSRTRKTSLTFSLGPAVADGPVAGGSQDVRHQYRVIADAALNRQVGRTWNIGGAYRRGLGYFEGFQSPVFTGAFAATAAGFLNRRTDLSLSAAYSTGESTLVQTKPQFTTYTGDARLRIAVSRHLATYVEYLFYYYEFGEYFLLPPDMPPGLTRNGVRTGLTIWIPVRRN